MSVPLVRILATMMIASTTLAGSLSLVDRVLRLPGQVSSRLMALADRMERGRSVA